MQPDRAHRFLNTTLLVVIMAITTVEFSASTGQEYTPLHVAAYGTILLLFFVLLKVGYENVNSIKDYLDIERASPE